MYRHTLIYIITTTASSKGWLASHSRGPDQVEATRLAGLLESDRLGPTWKTEFAHKRPQLFCCCCCAAAAQERPKRPKCPSAGVCAAATAAVDSTRPKRSKARSTATSYDPPEHHQQTNRWRPTAAATVITRATNE